MPVTKHLSRRDVLRHGTKIGIGLLVSTATPVWGQTNPLARVLRATPGQVAGPFYPVVKPLDSDADLTRIEGRPAIAKGRVMHLAGRVFDREGKPIRRATIEIWQANSYGRYAHESDRNTAPLDPDFQGYGVQKTDDDGRYHFKTIKPAGYPFGGDVLRPPHIHFEIAGNVDRKTTQMYFPGEPLNDTDELLQGAGDRKHLLIATKRESTADLEAEPLFFDWDIYLPTG